MTAYMPLAQKDDWTTPQWLFDELNAKHNFTLDAAASSFNHLCSEWFGLDHPDPTRRDGLNADWYGNVWVNPPYGRVISQWAAKMDAYKGKVVMLLPARTDTRWFHDYCIKHEIVFIKGRLKFGDGKSPAPFPSMLVIRHAV